MSKGLGINFVNPKIALDFLTNNASYGDTPPEFGDVISQNTGLLVILGLFSVAALVGLYFTWVKMFGKKDAWKAIIPVYNFYFLFRAVDVNPLFAFVTPLPLLGLVPLGLFNFYLPRAFGVHKTSYSLAAVFMPWLMLLIFGCDKQYEYQYVKGKNVPFRDSFRIPAPGEEGYNQAYTPNEVGAIGSQISQAAALNAANNEKLRKEIAEREAKEAAERKNKERQKLTEQAKTEDNMPTVEVSYDIFDNGTMEQTQIHVPEENPDDQLPKTPLGL